MKRQLPGHPLVGHEVEQMAEPPDNTPVVDRESCDRIALTFGDERDYEVELNTRQ